MSILREVSELKNNCYELKRSVWNDVMEDWPFYSEADRSLLRRRKPQNLTPPVSDTGSTSSGHSPSSTNPASPPQITNPLKRHGGGFYESPHRHNSSHHSANSSGGGGGSSSSAEPNPKKKRVSHYKRPDSAASGGHSSWMRGSSSQHGSSPSMFGTVSPAFGGGSGSGGGSSFGGGMGGMSLLLGSSPKGASDSRLDPSANFVDESAPDWAQFHDHDQQPAVAAVATTSSRRETAPSPGRSPATAAFGGQPDHPRGRSPREGEGTQRSPGRQQQGGAAPGATPESDGSVSGGGGQQLNMPFHFHNANKDFLT
jgi:hypothetical protein